MQLDGNQIIEDAIREIKQENLVEKILDTPGF